MSTAELQEKVGRYNWYHSIKLSPDVTTPGHGFDHIWKFIEEQSGAIDFTGKKVIDIGCRDGLFALMAERRGAKQVIAVDNDVSRGAKELVLPHLRSHVEMIQRSIYDLGGEDEAFDITMLLGVLYHLRYPYRGLRTAVDITKQGGVILIEGGFYRGVPQDLPMLYCPFVDGNPYEPGSPSFFNPLGLKETMKAMGCVCVSEAELDGTTHNTLGNNPVSRGFFVFRREGTTPAYLQKYWDGVHDGHTDGYAREMEWRRLNAEV